ncbi:MAG: 4Fe-4S dicluster domain-containing protein [Deltaproteobacteria bacterium]|nr:4Fe-4S dicluster domain-containing protein [Deltaproteobacteria bacterium]
MARWGMVIDLRKCIGCKACTVVCEETNQVPPNRWRRVNDCGISEYPERQRLFLPMSCMHCGEPPCLEVCPTTATYRRPDGIVDINYELCVGCGYCILACPYQARTIFHDESNFETGTKLQKPGLADPNIDRIGVCTKCNFCLPRVDAGLAKGLQPGLDPEASPACVISCSANALNFGDLDEPDSVVSRLIRENKTARLQEELGTDPSVYYIVDGMPFLECRES